MTAWSDAAEHAIVVALQDRTCSANAAGMAGYMRDLFPFHGISSPDLAKAWRAVKAEVDGVHGKPDAEDLLDFADAMWEQDEREHQYVAAKSLAAGAGRRDRSGLGAHHLDRVQGLIVTKSWWDTVDTLAPNVIGPLARAFPKQVVPVLDRWIVDDDKWLVRTALIHQLKSKQETDPDRLARYCLAAAPHQDFFVRKAIGWALRQYSYVDPTWVEAFVADHEAQLSGLSQREAMKAIVRSRKRAAG